MSVRKAKSRKRSQPQRETSPKGEERRQQILVAARNLLMSGGPDAVPAETRVSTKATRPTSRRRWNS